jgi:hypothetical protein
MLFVVNGLMWTMFTKAMNLSNTVTATVINSSTNYFASALFGFVLFSEPLPFKWWLGSSLILAGLFMMIRSSSELDKATQAKKTETSAETSATTTSSSITPETTTTDIKRRQKNTRKT